MKLSFSFLFFISMAQARDVILILHQGDYERAIVTRDILVKKMNIPEALVSIRERAHPCEARSESVLHLCFDSDHEMQIPWINRTVLNRTLKIFGELKDEQIKK